MKVRSSRALHAVVFTPQIFKENTEPEQLALHAQFVFIAPCENAGQLTDAEATSCHGDGVTLRLSVS